jgi:hypothetical protein
MASAAITREALKSLKELGLVSIRTGSGTYVIRPTMKPVRGVEPLRCPAWMISPRPFYEIRHDRAESAAWPSSAPAKRRVDHPGASAEAGNQPLTAMPDLCRSVSPCYRGCNLQPLVRIIDASIDPLHEVTAAGHSEPSGTQAGLAPTGKSSAIQKRDTLSPQACSNTCWIPNNAYPKSACNCACCIVRVI